MTSPGSGGRPTGLDDAPDRAPTPAKRFIASSAMAALCLVFLALGTWQVHRLFWKLDLIARVEARVNAPPVPAPMAFATFNGGQDEYRHVAVTGRFRAGRETLVQAVTELGPGFWVLTPLDTADGQTVLINRGFVPANRKDQLLNGGGNTGRSVNVTGLLRLTEPGGGFLRSNDPSGDRWYSRDVTAIAASRHLADAAPYFIDADAMPNPGGYPIGGLTVVRFRNSHLLYAVIWYGLAAMSLAGGIVFWRNSPE